MLNIWLGGALALLFFCGLTQPKGEIPAKHWWQSRYDPTDDVANDKRSALVLYIDHGTGCHYLATSVFGSLTPRLDRDGKHICEPKP